MKFRSHTTTTIDDAAAQARVDAIVASARAQDQVELKRPLFREPPRAPLAPSTDPLDRRLEEEIAFTRRTLEGMGDALCDDPILLAKHQVALQSIDLLAQMLGHIASVVGAADRGDAVSRIGMVELRNRLTRECLGDSTIGLQRTAANPFSTH